MAERKAAKRKAAKKAAKKTATKAQLLAAAGKASKAKKAPLQRVLPETRGQLTGREVQDLLGGISHVALIGLRKRFPGVFAPLKGKAKQRGGGKLYDEAKVRKFAATYKPENNGRYRATHPETAKQ